MLQALYNALEVSFVTF